MELTLPATVHHRYCTAQSRRALGWLQPPRVSAPLRASSETGPPTNGAQGAVQYIVETVRSSRRWRQRGATGSGSGASPLTDRLGGDLRNGPPALRPLPITLDVPKFWPGPTQTRHPSQWGRTFRRAPRPHCGASLPHALTSKRTT